MPLADVCTASEACFEARCQDLVWQAMKPDRVPGAIWSVGSEAEIVDALLYARATDRRVSIVSGGHSYIGNGIQDDSIVLDLAALDHASVNRENRRGSVGPGVRVAAFDALLERAGLAFPIGHELNVGVVGYLLGGGLGWNPNRWNGMACFNVTAADIILASGERVVADSERHADLFWAVRGAGPNFCGVVTRLHLQLFPRPEAIFKSVYEFSIEALDSVLAWLAPLQDGLDDRIELSLTLAAAADRTKAATRCFVSVIFFTDLAADAFGLSEPFSRSVPRDGLVARDELMVRTFAMLLDESRGDATKRHAVESIWTDNPYAAARMAADAMSSRPSSDSLIDIALRSRAAPVADAACSIVTRGFVFIDAMWTERPDDQDNRQWVDHLVDRLQPLEEGAYVSETDWVRRPDRIMKCYSPDALQRLREINRRYDPANMFIKPLDRLAD